MMEKIDRKPGLLMPVLTPTRELADKTYEIITPDLLGILELAPGIYSDKQH